jgi:hypothetical protein
MKLRPRGIHIALTVAAVLVAVLRSSHSTALPRMWKPRVVDRWLYQIGDAEPALTLCVKPFGKSVCVSPNVWVLDLYASDGVTLNREAVRAIHRRSGHAVCYLSGGTWEDWRPDAKKFPAVLRGTELSDWPGERWVDIRKRGILKPILKDRAVACKKAGFDAIDWDNVDGFTQESGFDISANDQLAYNRMLAGIAHGLGLSVGLKNDLTQVHELLPQFDFAVNEQCVKFGECDLLIPFTTARKAVVQIEYGAAPEAVCPIANRRGWSAMVMARELNASSWKPCR